MNILKISLAIQKGQISKVKELVQQAMDENIDAEIILNKGLLKGMDRVGEQFKKNEVFVPEVLIAARAMKMGIDVLKPKMISKDVALIGKAVIGTIEGDIHDIGKNLVGLMMESVGIHVIDLGVNVNADQFIQAAEKNGVDIICISSLLTTTMGNMKTIIDRLNTMEIRKKYTVMVGGSPLTSQFANQIQADIYTPDAATAAEVAKNILISKRRTI